MDIFKNSISDSLLLQHNKEGFKGGLVCSENISGLGFGFFAVSYMMGGVKNICLQLKDPLQTVCQAWEFSWD